MNPFVIQPAGVFRQEPTAGLDDLGIHFHQIDGADGVVPGKLPDHAAVSGADDQHVLDVGMDRHGDVGHHLVVDEFVPLGEHHIPVQGQHPAEFRGVVDVNLLIGGFLGVQVPLNPDAVFHVRGMKFTEP